MDLTNRDLINSILALNEGGGSGGGTGGTSGGDAGKDPEGEPKGDDPDDKDDDPDDDEPLGEKGKKALDAEKERRREATRELRKFKDLGYTPEQIAELARNASAKASDDGDKGDQRDADELVRQARDDARKEAQREALHERVQDKIEARAAQTFADPEDAVAILLRTYDINDFLDGDKIDAGEIADRLKALGEKKPHLLAQGKRFQGGSDGGARSSAPKRPGSLSEAVGSKITNR